MKAGVVFLPDGRAEININLDDDVPTVGWQEWSPSEILAFDDLVRSFPLVSKDPETQASYLNMRLAGESHNIADMLAHRTFAGVKSDAVFNEGKFSGVADRCQPEELWLRSQAEAAGVSTTGKWYCRGLASFPGDPTAWIDSRGDVLRIAKEKNMKVSGYVEQGNIDVDPGSDVEIADDIIENEVADIVENNPGVDVAQVRDEIYKLRTGAVDDNALLVNDYHSTDIP